MNNKKKLIYYNIPKKSINIKMSSKVTQSTEKLKNTLYKELVVFIGKLYSPFANLHKLNDKLRECIANDVNLPIDFLGHLLLNASGYNQRIDSHLFNQLLETYNDNFLLDHNNLILESSTIVLLYDNAYEVYLKKFNSQQLNDYIETVINKCMYSQMYNAAFDKFIENIQTKHTISTKIKTILLNMEKQYLLNDKDIILINIYKGKNGGVVGLEKFLKNNPDYCVGETELNYAIISHDINLFNFCLDYKVNLTKYSIKLLFNGVKVSSYFDNTKEKYVFVKISQYGQYTNEDYSSQRITIEKIILEYANQNYEFSKDDLDNFLQNGITLNPSQLGIEISKDIIDLYCKYNCYDVFPDMPEPSLEGLDHLASFVTTRTVLNKVCEKYNMKPTIKAMNKMCERSNGLRSFKNSINNLITKYELYPDQDCLAHLVNKHGNKSLNFIFEEYIKNQESMKNKMKKLEEELAKYKKNEVMDKKETNKKVIDKKRKLPKKMLKIIPDEIDNELEDEEIIILEKGIAFEKIKDVVIKYAKNDLVTIPSGISKLFCNKKSKMKYFDLKDKFFKYIFEKNLVNKNNEIIIDKNFMKILEKENINVNDKFKESEIDTFLSQIILKK